MQPVYGEAAARVMIAGTDCNDFGVLKKDGFWSNTAECQWQPSIELDGPDTPDPLETPNLPIPFNVNQLAAFMLGGAGEGLLVTYGGWDSGPDEHVLLLLDGAAIKVKEALFGAYAAYRVAESVVGKFDKALDARVQQLDGEYQQKEQEAKRRTGKDKARPARAIASVITARGELKAARLKAGAEFAKWRKKMVMQLLQPKAETKAQTAPAQQAGTVPAPEWQSAAQTKAREIIKHQRVKDLYPSQTDIADQIAKEFRAATPPIVGAGGKPLTGAYIKRHALKGISSAQGRQLSTSPRRGK